MLSRMHSSIALSLLASACVFAGCVIRGGDGTLDDEEDVTSTATTTTSSTTSATTGGGGEGGAGGSGAGVGGSGGSGGGVSCVGIDGTGLDVKSCDNMNITPSSEGGAAASICDDNGGISGMNPPPGYGACQHGFEVFNKGPAEYFQKCLAEIGVEPANACAFEPVQKCSNNLFAITCTVEETTKKCEALEDVCQQNGQTLDVAGCAANLAPFNTKALGDYEDCFNNADVSLTCQQAHDKCFLEQL